MSQHRSAVYVVDGYRTPFFKAKGSRGLWSASELSVKVAQHLLLTHHLPVAAIEQLILGCVVPEPFEANIARLVALRLDSEQALTAWTVQRNCGSGLQAIDAGRQQIQLGLADLVMVGGCDALSRSPVLLQNAWVDWLAKGQRCRSIGQRLRHLRQFKRRWLKPEFALLQGLTDPTVRLSMGQTAENLADRFGIDREAMDRFALASHQRLQQACQADALEEIVTIYDHQGHYYQQDTGLRADGTLAQLAALKPSFDKPFGLVTAGNSSQVTDGAALLLLANEDAIKRYHLPVKAKIIDIHWAALDPAQMGLGPVYAATPLLLRHQLQLTDIDYWEINEAFAAQVLACLRAWQDKHFCQQALKLPEALGEVPMERLNVHGGAISLGHPLGATGARLVVHLAQVLQQQKAHYGLATMCIGGGQGGAILLERKDEV